MLQLALVLDRFSEALIQNLQQFIDIVDTSGVGTIWTCCVVCLGHLAPLSHLLSQTEPTLRDLMDDVCDSALEKLGNLSHEVYTEEYSHFDALTGVRASVVLPQMTKALTEDAHQISWKRALDTIDERIESRPHLENGSLRHWRGVIGMVYTNFQANPLGYGPDSLVSLALSVDGRTADSSYPNLLLAEERECYGL